MDYPDDANRNILIAKNQIDRVDLYTKVGDPVSFHSTIQRKMILVNERRTWISGECQRGIFLEIINDCSSNLQFFLLSIGKKQNLTDGIIIAVNAVVNDHEYRL